MTPTDNASFRRWLRAELAAYPKNPKPISFEGKSDRYTRVIVSDFNTDNNTSYSVLKHGNGLLVGLRSDCRNYVQQPVQPVQQVQPAPPAKQLTAVEHMQLAVDMFRAAMVSGDEMRAQLNELLTDNDDLL